MFRSQKSLILENIILLETKNFYYFVGLVGVLFFYSFFFFVGCAQLN